MDWKIDRNTWKLKAPFTTARHYFEEISTLTVVLNDGLKQGRGEAVGVDNLGESLDSVEEQITGFLSNHPSFDRATLQDVLPPGGARNAIDCAFWDLECKRSNSAIWELLKVVPKSVHTVYTIPIEEPPEMAANAAKATLYPILKVKLDADRPIEKMRRIREARPEATLIVDCNQGWTMDLLRDAAPKFHRLGVEMIEQPLKVGADDDLHTYRSPIPLCADESCNTRLDLPALAGKYQMINIKLDKTGGLTEALALVRDAQGLGFDIMVGNMLGSSLGMAPAFAIAQFCKYVDLDGPLLQMTDCNHALSYDGSLIAVPIPELWG